jgi:hypothetical protein
MGVDSINTSGTFKVTRENVDKFLIEHYPNDDSIKEVVSNIGWRALASRQDGITKINRECEGWVDGVEFEFFQKLAPYVENGSFIIFETIYDGASYEKWGFEDGKLVYYKGEQEIKWERADPPIYRL